MPTAIPRRNARFYLISFIRQIVAKGLVFAGAESPTPGLTGRQRSAAKLTVRVKPVVRFVADASYHSNLMLNAIETKQMTQNITGPAAPFILIFSASNSIGPVVILSITTMKREKRAAIGRPMIAGNFSLTRAINALATSGSIDKSDLSSSRMNRERKTLVKTAVTIATNIPPQTIIMFLTKCDGVIFSCLLTRDESNQ